MQVVWNKHLFDQFSFKYLFDIIKRGGASWLTGDLPVRKGAPIVIFFFRSM